jgi:D-hexose-6-phosphate mutarotase
MKTLLTFLSLLASLVTGKIMSTDEIVEPIQGTIRNLEFATERRADEVADNEALIAKLTAENEHHRAEMKRAVAVRERLANLIS